MGFIIFSLIICIVHQIQIDASVIKNDCTTVDEDPDFPNVPCIFPFKYEGKVFHECTNYVYEDFKVWCATEVNETTQELLTENSWAECSKSCPSEIPNTIEHPDPNGKIYFLIFRIY